MALAEAAFMPSSREAAQQTCRCVEREPTVQRPDPCVPARALVLVASPGSDGACPELPLAARMKDALQVALLDSACLDLALCEAGEAGRLCRAAHAIVFVASAPCPLAMALFERMAATFESDALAGRAYGLLLDGPVGTVEASRRAFSERLDRAGLIDAGAQERLDCFIGCEQAYTMNGTISSDDDDGQPGGEPGYLAHALANAVLEIRAGRLKAPDLLARHARRQVLA